MPVALVLVGLVDFSLSFQSLDSEDSLFDARDSSGVTVKNVLRQLCCSVTSILLVVLEVECCSFRLELISLCSQRGDQGLLKTNLSSVTANCASVMVDIGLVGAPLASPLKTEVFSR